MWQEGVVFHVDKNSQMMWFLALLSRQFAVRAERIEGDAFLLSIKCKEDTRHRRNIQLTTHIFNDVLMCEESVSVWEGGVK